MIKLFVKSFNQFDNQKENFKVGRAKIEKLRLELPYRI